MGFCSGGDNGSSYPSGKEIKIETKKPLNNKLDENLVVLKEDVLVFYENNLYKFALMSKLGEGNKCNIISEGKIATYRPSSDNGKYDYDSEKMIIDFDNHKIISSRFFKEFFMYEENINLLTKDQKELLTYKDSILFDKIKISDLLSIENQLNKNELAKQNEKNEIRMGYGF